MTAILTFADKTAGGESIVSAEDLPAAQASRAGYAPSRPVYANWHEALKDAVRDAAQLCGLVGLAPELAEEARRAAGDFPLFAPRAFIARMRRGDRHDPLLLQVLPLAAEQTAAAGFTADPVDDQAALVSPGLLQKYQSRALMVTNGACAVHCRYCFRRHFPYADGPHSLGQWQAALAQIAADPSLEEIILSGGDPLMLVDEELGKLVAELSQIPHLRRLRIHTRLPIMIPERVTEALINVLTGSRLTPIVVLHANHANELDDEVSAALARLSHAAVPLLNQAVLLAGVNDSLAAQVSLCQRLIDLRVMPYYLHQLDRVAGAAHFEVPEQVGRALIDRLRERLPGYMVPRYVRESPGAQHKVVLA